ncbi:MAG: hypothetical protein V4558_04545, partial [Gemmatimonadota bacterium]
AETDPPPTPPEQIPDDPDYEEIKANLGNLEELLEWLDDSLSDKLNELRGTTDPGPEIFA